MSMDRIVVTGGGSAGHVLPIIPLIEKFIEKGIAVHYVGSHAGIDKFYGPQELRESPAVFRFRTPPARSILHLFYRGRRVSDFLQA